jgi:hypothetical protein
VVPVLGSRVHARLRIEIPVNGANGWGLCVTPETRFANRAWSRLLELPAEFSCGRLNGKAERLRLSVKMSVPVVALAKP